MDEGKLRPQGLNGLEERRRTLSHLLAQQTVPACERRHILVTHREYQLVRSGAVMDQDRAHIFASMRAALDGTAQGGGAALLLSGAAGMGKTHLARRFLDELPHDTARLVSESPSTGSPPLLPICRALASDGRRPVVDDISATVKEYRAGTPILADALAPLLKMPRSTRRTFSTKDAVPVETHTFFALSEVLRRLGRRRRTVLFIDDIQWLDRSSVAFLGFLGQQLVSMPVLVLLSARTNGVEPPVLAPLRDMLSRSGDGAFADYHLAPLSPGESVAAAERFLGATLHCTDHDARWLQRTSKGIPQYLKEVMELLRDRGSLHFVDGAWRFACVPDTLIIPRSLREMTLARVKSAVAFDLEAESLLNYAAICGNPFDMRTIARAAGVPLQRAMSLLARVSEATGFIRRMGATAGWEFDHALTREALLDNLGDLASDLHREVADLLARESAASAVSIAYHYKEARAWRMAADGYKNAAEEAAGRFAFEEAVAVAELSEQMLVRAECPRDTPERLEIAELVARCLLGALRFDRAAEYLAALHEAGFADDRPTLIYALARAKRSQMDAKGNQEAMALLRAATQRLGPDGDPNVLVLLWTQLVLACNTVGDYEGSRAAYRRAYAAAEAARDPLWQARLLRLTCMFWQPEKVIDATTHALTLARANRLRIEEAYCLNNLGTQYLFLQRFDKARESFESSRRLLVSCGGYRKDVPTNNLGLIALAEGRIQDARALFGLAMSGSMTRGDLMLVRINNAAAKAMSGDVDTAIVELHELAQRADAMGDTLYRDYARHNLARALLQHGRAVEALDAIMACSPRYELADEALVLGKRAQLLIDVHTALGREIEPEWERQRAVLMQTTKPQAWLYRLPWEVCDLQFWQS